MPYPKPEVGLVIGYSYLWQNEEKQGYVEGRKNRPCAIIFSVVNEEDEQIVMVLPITHTESHNSDDGVEIPLATKKRLGLDGERSWIIISELNKFVWPGPDLRPISRQQTEKYDYGFLPPTFYDEIKEKLLSLHEQRRVSLVKRTE